MATLVELAAQLVAVRAKQNKMSSEEVVAEISKVHAALMGLKNGPPLPFPKEDRPAINAKEAFKKDEVICLVCGKCGFKTLTRHLKTAHHMQPKAYRKEFGIPPKTSLSARSYSEAKRKAAKELKLSDNLERARKVRMERIEARKVAEAVTPAKRVIVRKKAALAVEVVA